MALEPELYVHGDAAALAQAITNLLANAHKYTPAEGKRIEITAAGDPKHVTISVADNGPGVLREERDAIFDKFQRGSAASDTGSPGTGLGLAVVRAIVSAHRGKVDVRAESPRGARFRIILPRPSAETA